MVGLFLRCLSCINIIWVYTTQDYYYYYYYIIIKTNLNIYHIQIILLPFSHWRYSKYLILVENNF